jgi:SAM-dependent methyltransferase
MHDTALESASRFFTTYIPDGSGKTIVEIGSQEIEPGKTNAVPSVRSVAPSGSKYIGIDFQSGRGVDILLSDPYVLPLDDETADVCISSSCLEHSEFFWLVFVEQLRILKPSGILYLNVPSNGNYHRYPVDCWRFYPDSGLALQNWGRRMGYNPVLLESFVSRQKSDIWNDFVAVFVKDAAYADVYGARILDSFTAFTNGRVKDDSDIIQFSGLTEDQEPKLKKRFMQKVSSFIRRI